jgi:hypothetical protein
MLFQRGIDTVKSTEFLIVLPDRVLKLLETNTLTITLPCDFMRYTFIAIKFKETCLWVCGLIYAQQIQF